MHRFLILLALSTALYACDRSKINEQKYLEAGEQAVLPFKRSLKTALVSGLEKGPSSAIEVCRTEAPELAEKASTPEIQVGRTSSKLRNPANAPKPWMKSILERYESDPNQREPAVVAINETTVGYMEPIFVQPLCVTCHGSHIEPEIEAKLNELYPEDQATGYVPGDFRGAFWAELAR